MVWMSTTGIRTGRPSSRADGELSACPAVIRLTSKLVPPRSMQIRLGRSRTSERATPPAAPPTGPDRRVCRGRSDAGRAEMTPPLDCITRRGASIPWSPRRVERSAM